MALFRVEKGVATQVFSLTSHPAKENGLQGSGEWPRGESSGPGTWCGG